jgi:hypothetical protein
MSMATDLVTVYRSADMNAEQDATAVRNVLIKNGIDAQLADENVPGVVEGTWEVRVPREQVAQAEALVAQLDQDDPGGVDPSHELDMVTIAEFQGATGQMEALAIQSILDANGISAVLVGASTLPNLSFAVTVARDDVDRAHAALAEARAAGPAAAAEAAQECENPGNTSL